MRESVPTIESDDDIYTVTEIADAIRQCLETEFPRIAVVGEIANFKRHSSGHLYLSLRDERNALRVVMFRRYTANLDFEPADGMRVVASGRLSHYGGGGVTQLLALGMERAGRGDMELEFRRLLRQLMDEGLTDPGRKRPIPRFPEEIAVITSPTGAAIRDIVETLRRRWPVAGILHITTDVQGDAAPARIERAFEIANGIDDLDAVILARGGGSVEDLWTFNTETVARAVASSRHPVVTGIGHEIDTTIADYVSDLRAATPTSAAELVAAVPLDDALRLVDVKTERMGRLVADSSTRRLRDLELLMRSSAFPVIRRRLDDAAQALDRSGERLSGWWDTNRTRTERTIRESALLLDGGMERVRGRCKNRLSASLERLRGLPPPIDASREKTARLVESVRLIAGAKLGLRRAAADGAARALAGLGPESVIGRGYALCTDSSGERLVTEAGALKRGDGLIVHFRDGGADCRVEGKRKGRPWRKSRPSRKRSNA
ncbi:MAG: exodeoxyribonuclease VII large subunit [Candidatus Krumholzibacteriota bacterium]|nr:exodeoxyribonuclease VII large subunit [Candidatus Krumholzibacteriota bacterium]